VTGSVFADTLIGGGNSWFIVPTYQREQFEGGLGNDTIDGGAGWDVARYANATAAVTVNLGANGLGNGTATGADGNDVLLSIEEVRGSAFADTLIGDAGDNAFEGGGGNDTIDGAAGFDQIRFGNSSAAVTVTFNGVGSGTATDGLGGIDTFTHIEEVYGSDQNDTFVGGAGDESFVGRAGNDYINGGAGTDQVNYFFGLGGVTVNLASGSATDSWGNTDTLISIENIVGSAFNDSLIGDGGNNVITGGQGNDSIDGGGGNDTAVFTGNRANYSFSGSATNLTVYDLRAGAPDGTDTLLNVESLQFADGTEAASLFVPTYNLRVNSIRLTDYGVNEGSTVTFTVVTTHVAANTVLSYTLSGAGITTADIGGAALTGTTTVGADGTASFTLNLTADHLTEGAETLTATVQGQSAAVTVNDTSVPTYAMAASTVNGVTVSSVNEGETVNFNVVTTGLPTGTSVPYSISSSSLGTLHPAESVYSIAVSPTGGGGIDLIEISSDRQTIFYLKPVYDPGQWSVGNQYGFNTTPWRWINHSFA